MRLVANPSREEFVGFFSKKAKVAVCDMCGLDEMNGCGTNSNHVVEIMGDEPAWLPSSYRAQARGQFTWMCSRCNSYPAMKWPRPGGAAAGMELHLGAAHSLGQFKGGVPGVRTEMIPLA